MRADAIWTFFKKVTKCRLLFLSKSDLRIFEKPGETKILTDGTVAEIFILSGGCTEGGALCAGNAKGRQLHAGVKGQSPLSGQG